MDWMFILILFIAALVCCCMGFKRFVWFMSIGYGYAIAGIAVVSVIYGFAAGGVTISAGLIIANVVMAVYGIRLGTFLLVRETKNKAYKKILDSKMGAEPPVFVKLVAWIFMGVLYICETAGLHFRLINGTADDAVLYIGIVIMAAGAVIEALSDKQKSDQKAKNPNMVAMEGLFKIVRCPNYFGEILFWIGVFVAGVTSYTGALQWVVAVIGFVCIFYVMWDGAKRMEKGHIARYGEKPEYKAYADKTPILFPVIPLYHIYDPAKDKKAAKESNKESK